MTRIMRAGKLTKPERLRFPVLASYKMDGIRARVVRGVLLSKNDKRIPNLHCQDLFAKTALSGFDGELVVGPPNLESTMRTTNSGVMSVNGKPDVAYYVFDDFMVSGGFGNRYEKIRRHVEGLSPALRKRIVIVEQRLITDLAGLKAFEEEALSVGYEGIMVRSLDGPYKEGTSTEREGYLLKLKRFEDAEGKIIGYQELMHNTNERKADGKRSSHKEGLVPLGTLGALKVRMINGRYNGEEIDVPVQRPEDREMFWSNQKKFMNAIVKVKYFPTGTKNKPRFPAYLGLRSKLDL